MWLRQMHAFTHNLCLYMHKLLNEIGTFKKNTGEIPHILLEENQWGLKGWRAHKTCWAMMVGISITESHES